MLTFKTDPRINTDTSNISDFIALVDVRINSSTAEQPAYIIYAGVLRMQLFRKL